MKKRRELDALVNGKTNGRRKRKGQHDLLLENMSDSSEIEEFSIPGKPVVRKRGFCNFCATCVTLCGFFMLVACISAIVGLIWVHIELKQELDDLKDNLNQVQSSNQGTPEELSSLQTQLAKLSQTVQDLQAKEDGNVNSISDQENKISKLKEDVSNIENEVREKAPPDDLNKIKQKQATFGSDLETLQDDVKNLKDFQIDINIRFENLQNKVEQLIASGTSNGDESPSSNGVPTDVLQELTELQMSVSNVNTSLSLRLQQVAETGRQTQGDVQTLRDRTEQLDDEIQHLKVSSASTPSNSDSEASDHSTTPSSEQNMNSEAVENLIQNALENYSPVGSSIDLQTYNSSVQTQISDILTRLNVVERQDVVTSSVFLENKNAFQAQFQNINQNISLLQTSTSELRSLVEEHHSRLSDIDSKLANSVSVHIDDQSQNIPSSNNEQPSDVNPSGVEINGDAENNEEPHGGPADQEAEVTTKRALIGGDDGHLPEWLQLATTEETTTEEDLTTAVMYKDGVTTAQDVENEFFKWDNDVDGYVQYMDVKVFFGPTMPSEAELSRFDTDGDGRYSLAEMQAAFGLQSNEEQPVDLFNEASPPGGFPPSGLDEGLTGNDDTFKRNVKRARQQLADEKNNR